MSAAIARRLPASGFLTLVVLLCGLLLCGLIVYPLASMVVSLFEVKGRFSLDLFAQTAADRELPTVLLNTVILVVSSGLIALLIGSVLAWISERSDASLGWATSFVPLVPLLLPALAGTIGWVLLVAPRAGLVNVLLRYLTGSESPTGPLDVYTVPGMIAVSAMSLVPYAYLAVSSALRSMDASLEEASRMSGAGLFRTLGAVSLPMVKPALLSATVLILMAGLALFSVPAILSGNSHFEVLSVYMYKLVNVGYPPRVGQAVVLSTFALLFIQAILVFQWRVGVRRYQTVGAQGLRRSRIPLGLLRTPARVFTILYVFGAAILPLAALVLVSTEKFWTTEINPATLSLVNYAHVFVDDPIYVKALGNSLVMGLVVAIVDITIALGLSYYLSRSPGVLARSLDFISTLPSTLPHVVLGVAFLVAFSQPPVLLYGTLGLLLIAYFAIYMPQAMQSAKFAFGQLSPELAEASRVFGATEIATFGRILLPLVLPSALSGGLIVTVLTLHETNASVILQSVDAIVVGPTLYNLWQLGTVPPVAAFALTICALGALVALVSYWIGRRFAVGRSG